MNSTVAETIRAMLLATSSAIVELESNTLRIPRRLRMFTDADVPELQLLQAAFLVSLVSYALILNPLTELLFPFPGGHARARRMCVVVPVLAWATLVMVSAWKHFARSTFRRLSLTVRGQSYLPFRLMAEEPMHIIHDIYERLIQKRTQTSVQVYELGAE